MYSTAASLTGCSQACQPQYGPSRIQPLLLPCFSPTWVHLSTLQRPETGATPDFSFIIFRPHLTQAILRNAFAVPLTTLGLPSQGFCIALFTVASSHLYVLVLDSSLPSPAPAPLTPQLCSNLQGVQDSFCLFTVGNWHLAHYLTMYIC